MKIIDINLYRNSELDSLKPMEYLTDETDDTSKLKICHCYHQYYDTSSDLVLLAKKK